MATGTLIITSDTTGSPAVVPAEATPLPFVEAVTVESKDGTVEQFGFTEWGDVSDPPKKYRANLTNQRTIFRAPDPAGTPAPFRREPRKYTQFDTTGARSEQIRSTLRNPGAFSDVGNDAFGSIQGVPAGAPFTLANRLMSGSSTSSVDSLEAVDTLAGWEAYPLNWQREKRLKWFNLGTATRPGNENAETPGVCQCFLMVEDDVVSLRNSEGLYQPVWMGDHWRICGWISVYASISTAGYEHRLYLVAKEGDTEITDAEMAANKWLFRSIPAPAANDFTQQWWFVDLPVGWGGSVRFRFEIGEPEDLQAVANIPHAHATDEIRTDAEMPTHLYLPADGDESGVLVYEERLGDEDTFNDAFARSSFTPGNNVVAVTRSVSGGTSGGSVDPLETDLRVVDLTFDLINLPVGRRLRATLTVSENTIADTDSVEIPLTADFNAVATVHALVFPTLVAPVGKERRPVRLKLEDIGPIPVTPDSGAAPVLFPIDAVSVVVSGAVSIQPVAINPVTSWSATGLPTGVSIDAFTGEITGNPADVGAFPITVTATNDAGSAETGFTLNVEAIPNPVVSNFPAASLSAAYGFRPLVDAYAGNLFRVRRVSDDTEEDFAVGYHVTDVATFLGGGEGRVVTIYDQSGNGLHKTQATAATQPLIGFGSPDGEVCMVLEAANTRYLTTAATLSSQAVVAAIAIRAGSIDNAGLVVRPAGGGPEIRIGYAVNQWDTYNYGDSGIFVDEVATQTYPLDDIHIVRLRAFSNTTFDNPHLIGTSGVANNRNLNADVFEILFFTAAAVAEAETAADELMAIWL